MVSFFIYSHRVREDRKSSRLNQSFLFSIIQHLQLTGDYAVPKGSLVIPSLVACCHEGYADPEKFDPDRFGPERNEGTTMAKHFMPFGCGAHYCVGREYAMNHLAVFLALLASHTDVTRTRSDKVIP
jgi:sterol 22-desaturase